MESTKQPRFKSRLNKFNLRPAFEKEPITAYRQNKNLVDIIGSKKILDNKVVKKNNSKK